MTLFTTEGGPKIVTCELYKKNNEIREYFGNSFISRIDNIIELNKLNKNDIYDIISEDIKRLKSK